MSPDAIVLVLVIAIVLLVAFWVAYYRGSRRDISDYSGADAGGSTSGSAPADTGSHCAHGGHSGHDACAADSDGGSDGGGD